jgi:hypothetical protein
MTLGGVARRAAAALLGAGLLLTLTTAPAAPGSTSSTGSGVVRTPDVAVRATGSVPARVLLRPGGTTMQVDVTFTTSGRALRVEPWARVVVGSKTDHDSWAGGDLEHVRGATYRASVRLQGTAEARGTWDVFLDATATATFGPGAAAYDEVVFDETKIASFAVQRPSKIVLYGQRTPGGRTTLYGDAYERQGTYSGAQAMWSLPGAKVRLAFDPAGDGRRRHVRTVTVSADGSFRAELRQKKTGTWTAELVATGDHPAATATRKVRVG